MHQLSYYYLILRYPQLRSYINNSHMLNSWDDLFDFLIAIKTEENPRYV